MYVQRAYQLMNQIIGPFLQIVNVHVHARVILEISLCKQLLNKIKKYNKKYTYLILNQQNIKKKWTDVHKFHLIWAKEPQ